MSDIDQTLCEEALSIVQGARRERYDKPERNFERIALVWQALTDRPYTAHEVALMFVGLKIVRDAYSPQRDNKVDGIGYLLCADAVEEKTTVTVTAHDYGTIEEVACDDLDCDETAGEHSHMVTVSRSAEYKKLLKIESDAKTWAAEQAIKQAKAVAEYAKLEHDSHIGCACPLSMPKPVPQEDRYTVNHGAPDHNSQACYACIHL